MKGVGSTLGGSLGLHNQKKIKMDYDENKFKI